MENMSRSLYLINVQAVGVQFHQKGSTVVLLQNFQEHLI